VTPIQTLSTVTLAMALSLVACTRTSPVATSSTGPDVGEPGGRVQVWPGITEETTPSDLTKAWSAPWLNGDFDLKDYKVSPHRVREIASCAQMMGITENDVLLGPAWEHYNFREKSIRCRVMARVMTARPAPVGYARDLVASDDPGDLLPAAVAPAPGASGVEARSWRAADPTLKFDRSGARAGYHELIVGGAYRGRLTWWAAGDVDGDGIEDVVMFSNLAPTGDGASDAPNIIRAFVLTRKQPGGPVTIVQRFE
jgi:hypothetical protein